MFEFTGHNSKDEGGGVTEAMLLAYMQTLTINNAKITDLHLQILESR